MKKIALVTGARPNFMKIAPIIRSIKSDPSGTFSFILVHTGQHYDHVMSQTFFDELGIPKPDYNLEVGSGTHAVQTANVMIGFEEVCVKETPDLVMVVGDVNSTAACALVAKKLHIRLAHVEAGLRSRDMRMPEEINRVVTDAITDIFFVTEEDGMRNLIAEGHDKSCIHLPGDVMVDNLFYQLGRMGKTDTSASSRIKKIIRSEYAVMTMHRPSNVDAPDVLSNLIDCFNTIGSHLPLIFPIHPRTLKNVRQFGFEDRCPVFPEEGKVDKGFYITEPLGYMDFLNLWKDAKFVLTDSGGLQEETTSLEIPCVTIRENTERPITIDQGSNRLAGNDPKKVLEYATMILEDNWHKCSVPETWDGKASDRIVETLKQSV